MKNVLDVCCGSRSFWFDRNDSRAVFLDKRKERHCLDTRKARGPLHLVIEPDVLGDFTKLPFGGEEFSLVVFDPPHLTSLGKKSWYAKKYGRLEKDWPVVIRKGFAECFRVLRPEGILIFKWSEIDIPVSRVLTLTSEKPLFGHRSGKTSKTHWIVFQKPEYDFY